MRGNERNAYRLYPISKPRKEIRCFLQDVVCIISAICTSVWYLAPGMSKAPVPGTVLGGGTTGMYKHRQNQIPVHHPASKFTGS